MCLSSARLFGKKTLPASTVGISRIFFFNGKNENNNNNK
jgi:hypothetical protein